MSGSGAKPLPLDKMKCAIDLARHWDLFCDADPFDGACDFSERMENAGFIELVAVTEEALAEFFSFERGIELGGAMWVLTDIGRQAYSTGHFLITNRSASEDRTEQSEAQHETD